eukprot:ctg_1471.g497
MHRPRSLSHVREGYAKRGAYVRGKSSCVPLPDALQRDPNADAKRSLRGGVRVGVCFVSSLGSESGKIPVGTRMKSVSRDTSAAITLLRHSILSRPSSSSSSSLPIHASDGGDAYSGRCGSQSVPSGAATAALRAAAGVRAQDVAKKRPRRRHLLEVDAGGGAQTGKPPQGVRRADLARADRLEGAGNSGLAQAGVAVDTQSTTQA